MLIKETTLRRIIREEAQRVLREADTPAAQEGGISPSPEWTAVNAALTGLQSSLAADLIKKYPQLGTNMQAAIKGWGQCQNPAAPKSVAVLSAINSNTRAGPATQLAAVLVALSGMGSTFDNPITSLLGTVGEGSDPATLGEMLNNVAVTTIPQMKSALTPAPAAAPAPAASAKPDHNHVVKPGESLSRLLNYYYGIPATTASAKLYSEFANTRVRSRNPDLIRVGETIIFPANLTLGSRTYTRRKP